MHTYLSKSYLIPQKTRICNNVLLCFYMTALAMDVLFAFTTENNKRIDWNLVV